MTSASVTNLKTKEVDGWLSSNAPAHANRLSSQRLNLWIWDVHAEMFMLWVLKVNNWNNNMIGMNLCGTKKKTYFVLLCKHMFICKRLFWRSI